MQRPIRLLGLVPTLAALLAQAPAGAQGRYAPVTEADVAAMRLNHYFTANKTAHAPGFAWTFTRAEFVVEEGEGEIPEDLRKILAPGTARARLLRGGWKLEDDGKGGQRLTLSAVKADGKDGVREVSLPVYRSAPSVVRVGEVQYVFEVKR